MKTKIKEVQNYFADKLARGLYKVKEISPNSADVIVDKKYKFCLWISGGELFFEVWNNGNFMAIPFTRAQKKSGYKMVAKYLKEWEDTELKERELKTLKALQEKYPET